MHLPGFLPVHSTQGPPPPRGASYMHLRPLGLQPPRFLLLPLCSPSPHPPPPSNSSQGQGWGREPGTAGEVRAQS